MNPQGEDSVRLDCQTEPGNRISQPLVLIIAATPLNMIVGYSTRVSPMLAEPHYPGSVPPTPQPQLMLLSLCSLCQDQQTAPNTSRLGHPHVLPLRYSPHFTVILFVSSALLW